jgi:hypothetical protein
MGSKWGITRDLDQACAMHRHAVQCNAMQCIAMRCTSLLLCGVAQGGGADKVMPVWQPKPNPT